MNYVKILFFSGYNLKGIRVSFEISLLLSFYLLRFWFYLTFTFYHTDIEKSYALRDIRYDPEKFDYLKDFIFFLTVRNFEEFINITYQQFY